MPSSSSPVPITVGPISGSVRLHCLVLDGVYRRTGGEPVLVQADSPTDEALQALLHKIITRLMKLLTRRGVLIEEEEGSSYLADADADSDEARSLIESFIVHDITKA